MSGAYADPAAKPPMQGSAPGEGQEPAPDLAKLRRMVEDWLALTADARLDSEISIDYYDSKQWTRREKQKLAERHQPDIVFNRIKPAVNGIIGVIERGRSDPRAWPRTPQDEDSADVATDVLRYIADYNRFTRLKQDCFWDMLVPGTMAALVGVNDDLQVEITQVRWEEFIHDPRARRKDFADARWLGIAKWQYADDVAAMYPDVPRQELDDAIDTGLSVDSALQDRPLNGVGGWVDRKQRRLLVVELYYREAGSWRRCCFIGSRALASGPSPYLDAKGRPDCPIVAQSAFIDRDNARYGAVKDMRGPQDEINKRRSKLLHTVSVSQIQAVDPAAVEVNADDARQEAARPDGVIPYGWQKVPTADMANGQAQLLAEAKSEIERLGPNPASLGRDFPDASGRALQARTQAGLIELGPLYAGLEDWELRIYRQCWARVKQYWTAPQYIRVTDDEDAPQFVGLNVPRGAPVLQPPMTPDGQPNPAAGQPVIDPATGQAAEGPPQYYPPTDEAGQPHPYAGHLVFGLKNVVAEMDVDIIVDSQPDTANIQAEQFAQLMQLIGANPLYAQQVPFEVALELSALPHKRQIVDKLKMLGQQAQQGQVPQQVKDQLALAAVAASVEKTKSETALNLAKTQVEQVKPLVEGAKVGAETSRTAAAAHTSAFQAGLDHAQQADQRRHELMLAAMRAAPQIGEPQPDPNAPPRPF